jgi:hypothetical protein
MLIRVISGNHEQPLWSFLMRYGVQPPSSSWFHFNSAAEAMAYDRRFPRKRARHLGHLWHLMDPPGAIREVRRDTRAADSRVLAEPLAQP